MRRALKIPNDGIEFHGLDEYKDAITEVRRKYPDRAEAELRKLGNMLKKKAIQKTPASGEEHKQKLKKSYHVSQTKQAGSTLYIEFWNSSPHFHLIERGHKIAGKNGNQYGFAPGVHMVEQSMGELNEEMPEEIEKWLDEVYKELG